MLVKNAFKSVKNHGVNKGEHLFLLGIERRRLSTNSGIFTNENESFMKSMIKEHSNILVKTQLSVLKPKHGEATQPPRYIPSMNHPPSEEI